jgi:hypothetical protein
MSSGVSRYATEYGGSRVEVEVDESGVVSAEVRLVVDCVPAARQVRRAGDGDPDDDLEILDLLL